MTKMNDDIDNEEFNKARRKLNSETISFTCHVDSEAIQDIIDHYNEPVTHDYNLLVAGTKYQDKLFMFNKEDITVDKENCRLNINIRGVKDLKSGLIVWEEQEGEINGKD